ncbi:MAG TPA: type II toxin-antitoxin system prevent-host-death family antitoxin [Solirubrobacterales bacterium]|nr:type II toxin-antitoxin system prevent-host-death family antitoxin [Solirubrobacterales bacterium]
MIVEVTARELQENPDGLLTRVEAGETVVITLAGKPVADLVPYRSSSPQWLSPDEVMAIVETSSADPGLSADLERLAGDTTDDLGPIR